MRNKIIKYLIGLLSIMVFAACAGDVRPWRGVDDTPIVLNIQIEDVEGVDLLDYTKAETFLSNIVVTYEDVAYHIGTNSITIPYQGPQPFVVSVGITGYMNLYGYWLHFGGFCGIEGVENRTVGLAVGEGRKINLSYTNEVHYAEGEIDGYSIRRFYVNGTEVTDDEGRCGRFHFLYHSSGELEYVPSETKFKPY